MNNSIPLKDVSIIYTKSSCYFDIWCWTGSEGGHHNVFCEMRNLLPIF